MNRLPIVLSIHALLISALVAQPARHQADVVVYGGTASGVMAAYSAAQDGMHVILLEPGKHLGGMVTGGLSATDLGHFQIIGGYTRGFYMEAASHYGVHELTTQDAWLSEPHVDEAIFCAWLNSSHVQVFFQQRLRERNGVMKREKKITQITTEDGQAWHAKVFVDCSYEGDLMAQAGVSYVVGRESTNAFQENLAGVRTDTPKHQFQWLTPAYDTSHHLWPYVDSGPLEPEGTGDKKVQSYNLRLILTNDPANKLPWAKPEGYNPANFTLLGYYLSHFQEHAGRAPKVQDIMNPVLIPNHKADFNNNGAFSTDYIGKSWTYPDASYAERQRIWKEHLLYVQSFVYFIATDPQVPASLRAEMNTWGLSKDEFADTDQWPNQLYIREGRRMMGEYVIKQSDLQTERTKPDSIGMGSFNSDSHNIQRVAMPDGTVRNEGDVQVPVEPYEIPFRTILPKRDQVENLLVPVCLSASHVAYSSVRMEPQYMIIGQAAGSAAAIAIRANEPVQNVDVPQLQEKLRQHKAILHLDQQASR
ncbi:FAD-dependent oxidoreductase [Terracidiphilus gabretensis]|uniref:FAD-dependent oxidoreductase n=1 Tax=Terracidiphilus gabretensis TaxID=1577687 RepID=UPI00071C0A44|nr:FAD-dependent oxidoreductase [Terracidiphilus gabretensis]